VVANSASASRDHARRLPAKPRHLDNAPISEAILDIRAVPPPDFPVQVLRQPAKELEGDFPTVEERRLTATTLEIREGKAVVPAHTRESIHGFAYKSGDGLAVAQFRVDGFTYSRLKPYTSWEEILPRALSLWDKYAKIAEPLVIPRLAVRYINRLRIPAPTQLVELEDYLTAPPVIPEGMPQNYSSFLSRVVLEDPDTAMSAIVTQALEPVADPRSVTILLDIDAFKVNEAGFDRAAFPEVFESLRTMKNRIFFNSITEATAKMYDDNSS
jgi:uncharacterized protein (TIGR04255 family)